MRFRYSLMASTLLVGCGGPFLPWAPAPGETGAPQDRFVFSAGVAYPISEAAWAKPAALKAGDLNQDRHLDVVTLNSESNDVSIVMGRGDGTLQLAGSLAAPNASASCPLILQDLTGDAAPEIVLCRLLHRNHGDGSFAAAQELPYAVETVADLNRDGHLDLITWKGTQLNRGDSTFQPLVEFPEGKQISGGGAGAGDLNGDGNLDLVIVDDSGFISVLLGRGDGAFGPARRFRGAGDSPEYLRTVELGDFNGDRALDVIAAERSAKSHVWLGKGDGTFYTAHYLINHANTRMAIGDLDGDGRPDLATPASHGYVFLFAGRGEQTPLDELPFAGGPSIPVEKLISSKRSIDLVMGDLNEDGKLDLIVANETTDDVSVLLNRR